MGPIKFLIMHRNSVTKYCRNVVYMQKINNTVSRFCGNFVKMAIRADLSSDCIEKYVFLSLDKVYFHCDEVARCSFYKHTIFVRCASMTGWVSSKVAKVDGWSITGYISLPGNLLDVKRGAKYDAWIGGAC